MTAPTLRPCPFCGAPGSDVNAYPETTECTRCGAFGPVAMGDAADPAALWNRRPTPRVPVVPLHSAPRPLHRR